MGRRIRRLVLPSVTAPVAPAASVPNEPPLSWAPAFPDQHLRVPARQDGWSVMVLEPSLLTPTPAMGWAPAFPDLFIRVPRRQDGLAVAPLEPSLFLPPPFNAAFSELPAVYDAQQRRQQPVRQTTDVLEPSLLKAPPPLSWATLAPDAVTARRRGAVWDSTVLPPFQPAPVAASVDGWYRPASEPLRPPPRPTLAGATFVEVAGFPVCPGPHGRPDQGTTAHGRPAPACCPDPPAW